MKCQHYLVGVSSGASVIDMNDVLVVYDLIQQTIGPLAPAIVAMPNTL